MQADVNVHVAYHHNQSTSVLICNIPLQKNCQPDDVEKFQAALVVLLSSLGHSILPQGSADALSLPAITQENLHF